MLNIFKRIKITEITTKATTYRKQEGPHLGEYYVYCGPRCYSIPAYSREEAITKVQRLYCVDNLPLYAVYKRRIY